MGDIVCAVVEASSVKAGAYVGQIVVWAMGSCTSTTTKGTVQGLPWTCCQPL
jgi:hypothetical protein